MLICLKKTFPKGGSQVWSAMETEVTLRIERASIKVCWKGIVAETESRGKILLILYIEKTLKNPSFGAVFMLFTSLKYRRIHHLESDETRQELASSGITDLILSSNRTAPRKIRYFHHSRVKNVWRQQVCSCGGYCQWTDWY
jgi:hypothetical protein